jgi:hypothetical protein
MTKTLHAELAAFSADENGLKNPTVLSVGEATGHGFYIDEKSLDGAMRLVLGRSVSSYLKHDGAGKDRLGQEAGFLSGIYREGQKLKAAAFEYFDTFKKQAQDTYEKLVEMGLKTPDQFGFSPVIEYTPVWVMADGTELPAALGEKAPAGAIRPLPSARILGFRSADLVKRPAVNVMGLLSADTATTVDASTDKQTSTTEATMSEIVTLSVADHEAKIAELSAGHVSALAAKDGEIAALKAEKDSLTAALAAKDEAHKAALATAASEAVAPVQAKLDEAIKFDARRLGVPPLQINVLQANLEAAAVTTPEEIKSAYAKLEGKARAEFRAKHWNVLIS